MRYNLFFYGLGFLSLVLVNIIANSLEKNKSYQFDPKKIKGAEAFFKKLIQGNKDLLENVDTFAKTTDRTSETWKKSLDEFATNRMELLKRQIIFLNIICNGFLLFTLPPESIRSTPRLNGMSILFISDFDNLIFFEEFNCVNTTS